MIIAVDFDGILCKNKFPAIGEPNVEMINFVRNLIQDGHEVVLWTSRTDHDLEAAIKWCQMRGLDFCSVNENAPSNVAKYKKAYPNGTRKVYADIYIDDHSAGFQDVELMFGYGVALEHIITITRRIITWKTVR